MKVRTSILFKMMVRSVIMITLSIMAVEIISYYLSGRQIRDLTTVQQTTLTEIYRERLGRKLMSAQEDLQFLADLPSVTDYFKFRQFQLDIEAGESLASAGAYFRKLIDRQQSYVYIALNDRTGNPILNILRDETSVPASLTEAELNKIATSDERVINLGPFEDSGTKLVMQRFVIPILVDSNFAGFIDLTYDHNYLMGDLKRDRIFDTGFLFVIANDGRVIYHPNLPTHENLFSSNPGLGTFLRTSSMTQGSLDQEDQFFSFSKMDEKIGWYVLAMSPKSEMFAVLNRIKMIVFLIVFLNILVEALFIFLFMRVVITRPIKKLLDVIKNIEAGDLNHRANVPTNDEIGVLADSFNHMIGQIQDKEAYNQMLQRNLEETVEIRTRELSESKNALALIFENAPIGLVKLDYSGKIIDCNSHFINFFSKDESVLKGCNIGTIVGEEVWQTASRILSEADNSRSYHFDIRYITKKEDEKFIDSVGVYSAGDEERDSFYILAMADHTERKRNEKQLEIERAKSQHASKMATLGEMAGGIAHEINNPLGVISMRSQQIMRVFKDRPEHMTKIPDFVDEILNTTLRIEKIIRGLRSFARSGERDPFVKCSVSGIIQDVLALCAERLRVNEIDLAYENSEGVLIECRAIQLAQILLNLISNAKDAVMELEKDRKIILEVKELAEEVEISLSNNGPQIPLGIRDKIMQPFFTTKDIGKGTGLGLSIAKGIVDDHNGWLFLDPESRWVRFVIVLPKKQKPQYDQKR
ncbi:MAG: HAMP domain-containing protein [Deltaproteobacteria bacterium]|nr:HAMP domain-containing protein [Deltaproteobacteria bacterium]